MEAYQQRVIDEKTELNTKFEALNKFLNTEPFDKLSSENQELLYTQTEIMHEYLEILEERIKLFNI